MSDISIGNGRALKPLLFATNTRLLSANIGAAATADVLRATAAPPHSIADLDTLPGSPTPAVCAAYVSGKITPQHAGVVLLGGYDVVPPLSLDVLGSALRAKLKPSSITTDSDHFVVWSDAAYADTDGDGMPELPISRIPDGHSDELVRMALQAAAPASAKRFGAYNFLRYWAPSIFAGVPGAGTLLPSAPTLATDIAVAQLDVDSVYLMLHGDFADGTYFYGEGALGRMRTIDLSNLSGRCPAVVFTGCCHGALCGDPRALDATAGQPLVGRTTANSMALSFLHAGALAFIGCTGTHYSPLKSPYDFQCQPFHQLFWMLYSQGDPPALALFKSKQLYLTGIPHRFNDLNNEALELKILHEFTCLGLGW